MTRYPEPRRVVLTLADTRRLTILERARACALAGIAEADLGPLLRTVAAHEGDPSALETGALLLYALAYQLERRIDPGTSWEVAQTWDLALDLEAGDPVADAEAEAVVDAAIATGLPPAVAGELTLAQLDAYRTHSKRRKHGRSRRAS